MDGAAGAEANVRISLPWSPWSLFSGNLVAQRESGAPGSAVAWRLERTGTILANTGHRCSITAASSTPSTCALHRRLGVRLSHQFWFPHTIGTSG